jgi:hypothetical protein
MDAIAYFIGVFMNQQKHFKDKYGYLLMQATIEPVDAELSRTTNSIHYGNCNPSFTGHLLHSSPDTSASISPLRVPRFYGAVCQQTAW